MALRWSVLAPITAGLSAYRIGPTGLLNPAATSELDRLVACRGGVAVW
jgi:hypothetical protein